ncbi:hypothetical protein [Psychrilyobacter sp.]
MNKAYLIIGGILIFIGMAEFKSSLTVLQQILSFLEIGAGILFLIIR